METRCPACGSEVEKLWEHVRECNGGSLFTGLYRCPRCWQFRATGIERKGLRKTLQWQPACPNHGADPVMVTEAESHDFATRDTEWTCLECGRRMAVVDKQIQTVWKPYQPIFPDLVGPVMQRIGGLPHD